MNYFYYNSPVGILTLVATKTHLRKVMWGKQTVLDATYKTNETINAIIDMTILQLDQYFNQTLHQFDIPIELEGTPFMQSVWKALMNIEYGQTCSYEEIAIQIGHPKACRAVGLANHRNAIPIIIPCHRVVGKNQRLVGFASGLENKRYLLNLEGALNELF